MTVSCSEIKFFYLVFSVTQGKAGVSAGRVFVIQHSVAERASALSAWSLVFLRINRFVRAEVTVTVAPAFATTSASVDRLVSFALPAQTSAPCTSCVTFSESQMDVLVFAGYVAVKKIQENFLFFHCCFFLTPQRMHPMQGLFTRPESRGV